MEAFLGGSLSFFLAEVVLFSQVLHGDIWPLLPPVEDLGCWPAAVTGRHRRRGYRRAAQRLFRVSAAVSVAISGRRARPGQPPRSSATTTAVDVGDDGGAAADGMPKRGQDSG